MQIADTSRTEQVFHGRALSPGVAVGRACFYRVPEPVLTRHDSAAGGADRLRHALQETGANLAELARNADDRLDRSAGDIFRAQRMLIEDPALIDTLENALGEAGGDADGRRRRQAGFNLRRTRRQSKIYPAHFAGRHHRDQCLSGAHRRAAHGLQGSLARSVRGRAGAPGGVPRRAAAPPALRVPPARREPSTAARR